MSGLLRGLFQSIFTWFPNSQPNAGTVEEIAALGRPANLGMLYDYRQNKLIKGITLWSSKELEDYITTVSCHSTKMEVLEIESNSEKANALKVNGQLKLDVFCDLVNLHGAASYLCEEKHFKSQVEVVFKYEMKSRFRHLTMEHLKDTKISHPEVLGQCNATHVVVGIEYGGTILMKFFQETTKEEGSGEVQATMKAAVEKLKDVVSCCGNADVSNTRSSTQQAKKIKCCVYSDFPADKYPTTYEEAVEFGKKLLSWTGDGVPVVLHLFPLNSFRSLLGRLSPTASWISNACIDKVCVIIERLDAIIAESNDLNATIKEGNFPILKGQLTVFMEKVQEYKRFFQEKISLFRDGSESIDKFHDFLKKHEASVFSRSKLTKWLDKKKNTLEMLQGVMESLEGIPFVNSGKLNAVLCHPNIRHVVCLCFRLHPLEDIQLLNMQTFLNDDSAKKFEESSWLLDITLIREPLKRFRILSEANERNGAVKFVVKEEPLCSMSNSGTPGAYVRYYYEGQLSDQNLIPSKTYTNLRAVTVSYTYVRLAWDRSCSKLNDMEDKVQYKAKNDEWQTSSAVCQEQTATIKNLKPATKYKFRIQAPDQIFLRENDEPLEVTTEPPADILLATFMYIYDCVTAIFGRLKG